MAEDGEFRPCKCGNSDIEVHRSGKVYVCRCTNCGTHIEYEVKRNANLFEVFEKLIEEWNTESQLAETE